MRSAAPCSRRPCAKAQRLVTRPPPTEVLAAGTYDLVVASYTRHLAGTRSPPLPIWAEMKEFPKAYETLPM